MAEEDTFTSMAAKTCRSFAWGADPDAATEGTLEGEIGLGTMVAAFVRRGTIMTVRKSILTMEVGLEGVRPKFGGEVGASKHAAQSIANGLVCTFDRSILVRRVGTSGEHSVAVFVEQGTHFGVSVELATLVEVDVLVAGMGGSIATEPGI